MLGVITGFYRGTILTRTKSIAAEKAESKAFMNQKNQPKQKPNFSQ